MGQCHGGQCVRQSMWSEARQSAELVVTSCLDMSFDWVFNSGCCPSIVCIIEDLVIDIVLCRDLAPFYRAVAR